LEERLIEVEHALLGAGFDGGGQFIKAILFDELVDCAGFIRISWAGVMPP